MGEIPSSRLGNNLFKETLIYSVGSFGSKVLSFLLLPLYTFFLTKKDLGEYDIFITTITLFVPLVSLQISDAAYRWLIDKDKENEYLKKQIISNSMLAFGAGFLLFSAFLLIYSELETFLYKGYFFSLMFLNCLLPILQSILRGEGHTKKFAVNGLLTTFLVIVFNVLFIYVFHFKVEGILLANVIAYTIACLLILFQINIFKYFSFQALNKELMKEMCHYSLPLIPNLMSWWVIGSASKFIILHYLGTEANGVYAISSRFPSIIVIVNSIFVLPIQDGFLKKDIKLVDFSKLLVYFFKIEFSIIVILIVGAPIYTKYVVNSEFYESWRFMSFLYLGVGFNTVATLISLIHQKSRSTAKITFTTIIGGAVSIGLCFLLVGRWGLYGISISYFSGFFVIFLLRYFDLREELNLGINVFSYIITLIGVIALIFLVNVLDFKYQLPLFVLVLILILFINRDLVIRVLKKH
ncbi:lipopolysaccharide biosynthesis protein [Flavobacterium sp. SLB02]|uniref:lipopolysaccharide biosynthesis protein n=1 Tax=Flavobacterium sp. SLB02 TaxID=2665645 RepID=UPI0012AA9B43|nr:oligosaccharide flippase family protein [Flavobacterium sp. SLB02]QGK76854.1 oligosaccharide flippase family protein [Flavobacterium sp. SLB02]